MIDAQDRLYAAKFKEPPIARTYLDSRCLFALAKALLTVDHVRAHFLAERAFRDVVNIAFGETAPGIPWELRSEQPLVFAFEKARDIGARQRPFEEARLASVAAAAVKRDHQRAQAENETPTAEAMFAELRAGNQLDLNGHSLEWDEEMDVLAGDNAYGIEYYWGSMTLASVARWRAAMLAGNDIGPCPPGADDDGLYDQYVDNDDFDGPERELYDEHESLQFMCAWAFTPDLCGLVPANSENS